MKAAKRYELMTAVEGDTRFGNTTLIGVLSADQVKAVTRIAKLLQVNDGSKLFLEVVNASLAFSEEHIRGR